MGGEMKSLYFPHDANARFDPKCITLIAKWGFEGYGIYWFLLEYLYSQDGEISDYEMVINELFRGYEFDVKAILNSMIDLNLLKINNGRLYSERMLANLKSQKKLKRVFVEAGKRGSDARWKGHSHPIASEKLSDSLPIAYDSNENESKVKEKEIKKKSIKEKNLPTNIYFKKIQEAYPELAKLKSQISDDEAVKLDEKYFDYEILGILQEMENYKLIKNYNSVYLTALKWLERKYGVK
jgi:hypothetical protein